MAELLEFFLSKNATATHSRSQSLAQVNEPLNVSLSTDLMDRSFDDERRNSVEQIKSIFLAKLESIAKTVPQFDVEPTIQAVSPLLYIFDYKS